MGQGTSMGKGYTLVEIILTVVVLTILGAFTFSVIWQYSQLYADTRKGYIYGEASAVLERISRELRDAGLVDPANPSGYINFFLTHGTPATGVGSQWVQYCWCSNALYRITTSQGAANQCTSCPPGSAVLMSRNITGFQVTYLPGDASTIDDDSYEIMLQAASDASAGSPSIKLVTRVSPRNYNATGRSFCGFYHDKIY
jgi:prepilin-type N-terminal cleavage/methylation domain-containing protein